MASVPSYLEAHVISRYIVHKAVEVWKYGICYMFLSGLAVGFFITYCSLFGAMVKDRVFPTNDADCTYLSVDTSPWANACIPQEALMLSLQALAFEGGALCCEHV